METFGQITCAILDIYSLPCGTPSGEVYNTNELVRQALGSG